MRRTQYYTDLWSNPRITLRLFAVLIREAAARGEAVTARASKGEPIATIRGYDGYTLSFTGIEVRPDPDPDFNLLYLSLKWEDDGEAYRQTIDVLAEESNLIRGSKVYYFICPNSGAKSRQLYYIGNRWISRRSFRHRYGYQNRSRQQRELDLYDREEREPVRPYGKAYYRGKLTPYGKRLERWNKKQERGAEALLDFIKGINRHFHKKR